MLLAHPLVGGWKVVLRAGNSWREATFLSFWTSLIEVHAGQLAKNTAENCHNLGSVRGCGQVSGCKIN
jgi:hypothetical protein